MEVNHQMTKLLKSAAERYRDNIFEDRYLHVQDAVRAITYLQFTGLSKRAQHDVVNECKTVLECADHVIVEMLFRAERVTGVRADLWISETSAEARARRDFIHARVDAKMKPLLAARAARRLRSLI